MNFNEEATLTIPQNGTLISKYENRDVTATNMGGGVHAGIDFDLDPNSDAPRIFIEASIKTGEEKSGGSYLTIGVRKSL